MGTLCTYDITMLEGMSEKSLKINLIFTRKMEIMKWVNQIAAIDLKTQKEVGLEQVYMRSERNSNWFEISNRFEKSFRLRGSLTAVNLEISNRFQKLFRLYGDFTKATFQTTVRFYCTWTNDSLQLMQL